MEVMKKEIIISYITDRCCYIEALCYSTVMHREDSDVLGTCLVIQSLPHSTRAAQRMKSENCDCMPLYSTLR
jgi:hypothetical protein